MVTGLGMLSPLGIGVEANWEAATNGRSGIGCITRFDASDFPVKIAGEVKNFNPDDYIEDKKEIKKMDIFLHYTLAAGKMAMKSSGLEITERNAERVGVLVGAAIGGLVDYREISRDLSQERIEKDIALFYTHAYHQPCAGTYFHVFRVQGA